ncbi:MAG: DUF4339 domain-containing protein [Opitutae bacterium]|jgi:hypothetical protein|nr:DUF4339 domain-containing protein [Opitutae bacterium]
MSAPELGLYVSSNDVDHGPLSLKEATERVKSGEFKPTDLAWHQGVSGWMPLKDLPEWNAMQTAPALPLAKKKTADPATEDSNPAMGSSPKKEPLRSGSLDQRKDGNTMEGFADDKKVVEPQGGGIVSIILTAFALLILVAALALAGWICFKKWDEIRIILELQ